MADAPPASQDQVREGKIKKQKRKMSKIVTKAWNMPHAHHFQESARATSDAAVCYDLASIGQKIDQGSYRLGRHGWDDFAKDIGGVYNGHIARKSKHATRAKSHLDNVVELLAHVHADLGPIASKAAPPGDEGNNPSGKKKRKSSEGGDSAPAKKKRNNATEKKQKSTGENMTMKEREANAMLSLEGHIKELGGSLDLIEGFKPKIMPRSDGRFDLNFVGADGKRFRSMLDVGRHFSLAADSKMPSKKKASATTSKVKTSNKAKPSNTRQLENEKRKARRELERMMKARQRAIKALDDFETNKKESRYPIEDDIIMLEEQNELAITPTMCPAARVPDIDGFPNVPSGCLPDLIMSWDFLCTFSRALSLSPISLDDFAAALTYQPPPSEVDADGTYPLGSAPPVYVAEAHLGLLKLLLNDQSSDEWWYCILETDEIHSGVDDDLATDGNIIDTRRPLIKVDMAALLADSEDPLITSSWIHVLEGVRSQKATATKPIRKAVKDAIALVTNKWVKAYLKKTLENWNRQSADFAKRAVIWLVDRMQEARPDLFDQAVKLDQLQTSRARVVEESLAYMEKMGDSEKCIAVEDDDVEGVSDDDSDFDDSEDEDEPIENGQPTVQAQTPIGDAVDESSQPAMSTLPLRPPPTLVDLLLPPAKPLAASDIVSSFSWPHLAGATAWRILHRYKRLRNEVDDSLRVRRELPPLTIGERRQREATVSSRVFSECAASEDDPSERAARHLSAGGSYLELSAQERLCVLRLLIEAAYDSNRVYEVVDDNFKSRIGAVKALEMEKRRARREAKEETAAAEALARDKLAAEARNKFLEDKRDQIESQNEESGEYSAEFIEGLTDEDIIEFDEETKAEYDSLLDSGSFNKAEVNKMVVRVQEENAFNTDALTVMTMDEIVESENLELKDMEEELASFGALDTFSMDRDTSKQIERLRRNIENMRHDAAYLPSERQDAVNSLGDAIHDGTIKALRAAVRLAKQANLQGEDEETGGLWVLDILRDAVLELKAAERQKRIIDAQKDLVQKRNKCFIRTEPIGSDRFRDRFWHFGNDEDGRVWAEADFIVRGDDEVGDDPHVPPNYVNLVTSASAIGVGAAEKEEDFISAEMSEEEKNKFIVFSRQEFDKEGVQPLLAKRYWGCHSTEKSLRSLMKNLDGRGTRELELKTSLKETLEEGGFSSEHVDETKSSTNGNVSKPMAAEETGAAGDAETVKNRGDEDALRTTKQSVKSEEVSSVVSQNLLTGIVSAIGQPVRVREIVEETRDRSVAHYKLGTIDAWKFVAVEADDDGDTPMSTLVPTWRARYERDGEIWLSGDELLDSLCRYILWKNNDKGYTEHDAAYLAFRNSLGRHCGKASDAPLSSSPMFLARLLVKREQELYFDLKNHTYDNNWGGKSGARNAWITSMKDYCYDFTTVRNGLITMEQAVFALTRGTPNDGSQPPPDAKNILRDEKSLFETELESIESTAEGLWNSRESRAVWQEIVTSSKTTGILALALDLLCRNCHAYMDRNKISQPSRRSSSTVTLQQAAKPRTTRRLNAWQRAQEDWY